MIPNTIKIGCYDYRIEYTDQPLILDGEEKAAIINHGQLNISISTKVDQQRQELNFWHEVVHGIIHYRNIDPKSVSEEVLVQEMALGLYLLCQQNGPLPGQNNSPDRYAINKDGNLVNLSSVPPGTIIPMAKGENDILGM